MKRRASRSQQSDTGAGKKEAGKESPGGIKGGGGRQGRINTNRKKNNWWNKQYLNIKKFRWSQLLSRRKTSLAWRCKEF